MSNLSTLYPATSLPDQASAGEITTGTETAVRSHSPADIVSYITQHETGGGGFASEGTEVSKTGNYTIVAGDLDGKTIQLDGASADSEFTLPTYVGRNPDTEGVYLENIDTENLRIVTTSSETINSLGIDMYIHKGEGRFLFRPTSYGWRAE